MTYSILILSLIFFNSFISLPDDKIILKNNEILSSNKTEELWIDLFNGKNLDGWINVNTDKTTWRAENQMIRCTGKPTGLLRTKEVYENFILECEWRHNSPNGNAGIFVWSDPLPFPGVPFARAVEVQVMLGLETENYTSEGDIFSIWGATMTPDRPHPQGWARCLPSEPRTNGAGKWNHYRITCLDGTISLAVNGKIVSGGFDCNPRTGHICLESEGSSIDFKNIRLKKLSKNTSPFAKQANHSADFKPLFNGLNLSNWIIPEEHANNWKVEGTKIVHNGSGGDLWSKKTFTNFDLICDWRWSGPHQGNQKRWIILPSGEYAVNENGERATVSIEERDSGIYLRGSSKSQINIWSWPIGSGEVWGYRTDKSLPKSIKKDVTPRTRADKPPGEWNRFFIKMRQDKLTVVLNGKTVIYNASLPNIPQSGPIGLQSHGSGIEFSNILIRELKK